MFAQSKNIIWFVLLLLLALITTWFSGKAIYELYSYNILNTNIQVYPIEFSVKEQILI